MKKIVKICSASFLALTLLTVGACSKKDTKTKNSNDTKVTTKSNSTKPIVSKNKTTKVTL